LDLSEERLDTLMNILILQLINCEGLNITHARLAYYFLGGEEYTFSRVGTVKMVSLSTIGT
jgi:hypothetical protein